MGSSPTTDIAKLRTDRKLSAKSIAKKLLYTEHTPLGGNLF